MKHLASWMNGILQMSNTIKERLYEILLEYKKPLTERELVEEYIQRYPDYAKNHTQTKRTSKQKIRGTIQSILKQTRSHPKVIIDESKSPYTYQAIH